MSVFNDQQLLAVLDALESHAKRLGEFERVNFHEPKNSPGSGVTVALWVQRIRSAAGQSGLDKTTARIEFNIRLYTSMVADPQDAIDPTLLRLTLLLMGKYSGDFTLDGLVRNVVLMDGMTGPGLSSEAGYVPIDNKMFRVMTISLPLIVNDMWLQESGS